jgi:hypothetical protein
MGAAGITFVLVDSTPYRIRYLMTAGEDGSTVLPNAAGVTPDLRTDALACTLFGTVSGADQIPLFQLLSLAVANQAQARARMLSHVNPEIPAFDYKRRCRVEIQPCRTVVSATTWSVDANEGAAAGDPASAGFPVLIVSNDQGGGGGDTAYLDIHLLHSTPYINAG